MCSVHRPYIRHLTPFPFRQARPHARTSIHRMHTLPENTLSTRLKQSALLAKESFRLSHNVPDNRERTNTHDQQGDGLMSNGEENREV